MCGIAGFASFGQAVGNSSNCLRAMGKALERRGPDDSGIFVDESCGVGFVHRRLSIVDLTEAGHQPMSAQNGRYTLLFNGELYNHNILRRELHLECPDIEWRGRSDTEVFLNAVQTYGLKEALAKSIGMFAFAIWDKVARTLHLGRDRAGEKPLYFARCNGTVVFGSDLNALRQFPGFVAEIDRESLALYLQCGFVPGNRSIFRDTSKVPSGSVVSFNGREPELYHYWSVSAVARDGKREPFRGDLSEAATELASLLDKSIADQLLADVPVGAFLSGGIDSTVVTAWMRKHSTTRVKTYTVGFFDQNFNEATHAKAVATELGTEHTEVYITAQDTLSVIPELPEIYSEPFADVSQIPLVLLSRLARKEVTVSLSGDGGDELFGGYNRHLFAEGLGGALLTLPHAVRSAASSILDSAAVKAIANRVGDIGIFPKQLAIKIQKLAMVLDAADIDNVHARLMATDRDSRHLVNGAEIDLSSVLLEGDGRDASFTPTERMMLRDFRFYMQDDVLVKVDRGAMSASLEVRAPLLDHRIIEFSLRLPMSMKISAGIGKKILRELAYKEVPRGLLERPKSGFSVPIGSWLRGPLRDWAEELLDRRKVERDGYLDAKLVRRYWTDHLDRVADNSQILWNILMFQAWFEKNRG